MSPKKLLALAFTFVLATSGLAVETQREVKKEVRSKLFKQVLASDPDVRDCVEKEEGGVRAAEENMSVEAVDLNRDGVSEYEVELSGPCSCGMVNCTIYLYRQSAVGYELILEGAAGLGLELLKTSTKGYTDLRVAARDNAATQSQTIYKYDGTRYREANSRMVNVQTGESKPASRRIQFRPGASSTSLQGTVTLELSDTLIVGARAGQVMTVQLSSPNKSVRFMVMTARTTESLADNKRTWMGTLPDTDDYLIVVESDKRATYQMTITVK